MRLIGEVELEDIALGAAVLGAGGGGDPHVGWLLAKRAVRDFGPVALVDHDEVADDAFIVPIAPMGAPTVANEKILTIESMVTAIEARCRHEGRIATHTMPVEVGGIASLVPLAVAARLRLPVVDADMMGRAFPEVQMVIPTLFGISASPLVMADEKGNAIIVDAIDNAWTERFARVVAVEMGASSSMALYAMSGEQSRGVLVDRSLTLAEEIGQAVRQARNDKLDPVHALAIRLGGIVLVTGKVVDVSRRTESGFALCETTIAGLDQDTGVTARIGSQNEHLVVDRDGLLVGMTPDLVIVVDSDSGDPVTTEGLRYGARVSVIAAPCDPRFRAPDALELVGPRTFGFDVDYQTFETLGTQPVLSPASLFPTRQERR